MKKILLIAAESLALILLCEFIFWVLSDLVVFNVQALEGPAFLYYLLPAVIVAALCLSVVLFQAYLAVFIKNLLIVLFITYATLCVFMLGRYCEPEKNLTLFYSLVIVLILFGVAWLSITKILPKMKYNDRIIVLLTTVITFVDFNFLLIGYRLFYPGFW